jgi:hypothetical protein
VHGVPDAATKQLPAWFDPAEAPMPGCDCGRCGGRRWWREAVAPTGWRCWTCHPPAHCGAGQVVEVST